MSPTVLTEDRARAIEDEEPGIGVLESDADGGGQVRSAVAGHIVEERHRPAEAIRVLCSVDPEP